MKKLLIALFALSAAIANAQTADTLSHKKQNTLFTKGTWELGLTGSFSSVSTVDDEDARTILSMSISPSYYITDGFFIEPELVFLINSLFEEDDSGYQLLLNAGYTFKTTKSFAPYVKAGYGIGNVMTLQYAGTQGTPLGAVDDDELLSIINAGIGMKWLVGGTAMIKTEINYRNQNHTREGSPNDENLRNIGLLLGLSIGL